MKLFSINGLKTAAFATLLATSVSACKRPVNYTPVARECVQPRTKVLVDSLYQEGKKIIDNEDFVFLGYDTLPLNKDFVKNPARFFEIANLKLRGKFNDQVVSVNTPIFDNSNRIGAPNTYDMYVNKQTILSADEFYTSKSDSKTVFVPVKYYATVNSKIKPFM